MNMTDQLNALAGNASCITLAVHTHPDGDAVGSGTGMLSYLLECKGADAVLVFPDRVPERIFVGMDDPAATELLRDGLTAYGFRETPLESGFWLLERERPAGV